MVRNPLHTRVLVLIVKNIDRSENRSNQGGDDNINIYISTNTNKTVGAALNNEGTQRWRRRALHGVSNVTTGVRKT